MARKIVITSGKGGVGKTTLCAELGKSLAKKGCNVLLVDLDIGLNNLDVEMNVENKIQYDILDVIDGTCRTNQAIVQSVDSNLLYILPSVHTFNIGKIDLVKLKNLINDAETNFDFVLIDSPAGIEMGFYRAVSVADEAIVVTTPQVAAIRNANRVLSILNGFIAKVDLLLNRVRQDFVQKHQILLPKEIAKVLGKDLIGIVPESDLIGFKNQSKKFFKKQDELKCFDIIAENVLSGQKCNFETKVFSKFCGWCG